MIKNKEISDDELRIVPIDDDSSFYPYDDDDLEFTFPDVYDD